MGVRATRWAIGGLAVLLVGLLVATALVVTSGDDVDEDLTAADATVASDASALLAVGPPSLPASRTTHARARAATHTSTVSPSTHRICAVTSVTSRTPRCS